MQKFLILALCVAAASAASVSVNPFTASAASIFAPKGVVTPVFRCGGASTFLQLRVSSCEGVCHLQPGTKYDLEVDLIPALAAPSLSLRVTITVFGFDTEILDAILANSSVQPGQIYTITFAITPNDILSGQAININGYITHTDTAFLELCLLTEVTIN